MNVNCNLSTCSFILNSKCVFYESYALPYTGINTNDSVEVALQKIEDIVATIISEGGSGVVQSIIAGTGISVDSTDPSNPIVTNTAPDQTVVLNNGTGISVTGTYPNFTITNTSPSSGGTVTAVSGTVNRITSTGGTTPVIDIAATYVGQSSITTLGTIGTGVWQGTPVGVVYGGTGLNTIAALSIWVANTLNTITTVTPAAGQSIRINAGGTAWEAYTPGSGGITNSAVSNELMKSDGTNAIPSGVFSSTIGNITIGNGSAGTDRTIIAEGTVADINMLIRGKGTGLAGLTSSTGSSGFFALTSQLQIIHNNLLDIDNATGSTRITTTLASTTGVSTPLSLRRASSGVPTNNIGVALNFETETSNNNYEIGSIIESIATDVTSASEDFDLVFKTMSAGAAAAERFRITSDGRLYGTALHNNAGSVTGITNQYIASGTYTPTLTNITNVASSSAVQCQWIRVGNVVHVSGWFNITATAAGPTATEIAVSIPVASNLSAVENLAGAGAFNTPSGVTQYCTIGGDTINDRATVSYQATSLAGTTCIFTFTYLIL